MVTVGIHPPDGYNALFVDIEDWLRDLEDYFLAKFGEINDLRKIAILRRVFGESNPILKEIISRLTAAQQVVYADVRVAVIQHFARIRSPIVERHNFHSMRQQVDEPIDSFVSRLREQASKCNFVYTIQHTVTINNAEHRVEAVKDTTDEMVRDAIVVGMVGGTAV